MLPCPRCSIRMKRHGEKAGLLWTCPLCDGKAATIPSLRRRLTKPTVNAIWQAARQTDRPGVTCPSCKQGMRDVEAHVEGGYQILDVCTKCFCVWFDPGEYEVMPKQPPKPVEPTMHARSAEALGKFELAHEKTVKRHRDAIDDGMPDGPDSPWKWLAGLAGFPVQMEERITRREPWMTWTLVVLLGVVGGMGFRDLDAMIERFGFLPDDPFRLGGLTALTAFFVHADWMHLLGNAYFLSLFGTIVEDSLRIPRYLALLALATVVGSLAYGLTAADPTIPAVGASGGISGVLAYHALRFPHMRMGILLFWFIWLRIPAMVWFLIWVLLQIAGAYFALDNVAYLAHLGGAVVGVAFWWTDRRRAL